MITEIEKNMVEGGWDMQDVVELLSSIQKCTKEEEKVNDQLFDWNLGFINGNCPNIFTHLDKLEPKILDRIHGIDKKGFCLIGTEIIHLSDLVANQSKLFKI